MTVSNAGMHPSNTCEKLFNKKGADRTKTENKTAENEAKNQKIYT